MTDSTTKPAEMPPTSPAKNLGNDLLASIVVFLVALPLCMGVAIASGAPVATGLITGIVGGIIVGMLAGCPLQVSGPAAGLTVIVYEIIEQFGLEYLGVIVLIAGIMQVLAGVFRIGQWFRAVSPAVIQGMLAGIGILILASQFHVMVDDSVKGKGLKNLLYIPESFMKALAIPDWEPLAIRQKRIVALRSVGELHRRQVDLRERVAEYIPHAELSAGLDPNKVPRPEPAILKQKMDDQQLLLEALDNFSTEILANETTANNTQRLEKTRSAITSTEELMLQAEQSIINWDVARVLKDQEKVVKSIEQLIATQKSHSWAAALGLLSIALIVLWKTFAPQRLSLIPPPLIAITVATLLAAWLSLPVVYVEVPDKLWSEIRVPSLTLLSGADWFALIQAAAVVAIVASAETLLCCTAVDQMHSGPRTRYDQELLAQGVGNTLCGFLGALPMTGVIVRSSANVQAGGKSRLSAILHGVWLLVFVVFLSFLLRMIPTASLAAILVYTGYKLVNLKSIKKLYEFGRTEVLIYLATVVTIVCTDLLTGVITGIVLAAVKLLYTFSHLEIKLEPDPAKPQRIFLRLNGAATFIRLPSLASRLEEVSPAAELHVDFEKLAYIDHACLDLLMNWAKQHQSLGGRLVIDWASLHGRFRGPTKPNATDVEAPTS